MHATPSVWAEPVEAFTHPPRVKSFFVYLLRCGDGSYYGGHTDNIELRMQQHYAGDVGYTSTRKPVELVWQGEFETREGAIAFEQQVKGWSRAKKEALIRSDWEDIKQLAKSKNSVRAELVEAIASPAASLGGMDGEAPRTLRQARGERGLLARLLEKNPQIQRRAIAKAITLLESTRADHRAQADELLTALLPHTGKSFRLGISGVPGVGKSTFIEALGLYLIDQGHRVAVLTIDPSSSVSGGSILGDKTRMEKLSVREKAYIRPSPSSGTLGGVAEKTREAMLVCEAAGYDVVIVETVGVGQSETAVASMTDMFVLMQLPNAGDDLQAIKKGVMELADLVVINKADIDPDAATRAQVTIASAMRLFGSQSRPFNNPAHPEPVEGPGKTLTSSVRTEEGPARPELIWSPQVMQLSALHGTGVKEFWQSVLQFKDLQTQCGKLAQRRQQQALQWMWERIDAGLHQAFKQNPNVKVLLATLTQQVLQGAIAPSTAARNMLLAGEKHA
jgi:LAO/AO transport system kinase